MNYLSEFFFTISQSASSAEGEMYSSGSAVEGRSGEK